MTLVSSLNGQEKKMAPFQCEATPSFNELCSNCGNDTWDSRGTLGSPVRETPGDAEAVRKDSS